MSEAPDPVAEQAPIFDPTLLVRQLLLDRTEGLSAAQVAAFVSGWTSALELVRRSDLLMPTADPAVTKAMAALLDAIEAAQVRTLGTGDDDD